MYVDSLAANLVHPCTAPQNLLGGFTSPTLHGIQWMLGSKYPYLVCKHVYIYCPLHIKFTKLPYL